MTSEKIICPICQVETVEGFCQKCGRIWDQVPDPGNPGKTILMSQRRRVRLTRWPEAGDWLEDVIHPA